MTVFTSSASRPLARFSFISMHTAIVVMRCSWWWCMAVCALEASVIPVAAIHHNVCVCVFFSLSFIIVRIKRWDPREFQFCVICVYSFLSLANGFVLFCFIAFHSFYFIHCPWMLNNFHYLFVVFHFISFHSIWFFVFSGPSFVYV